jgi:hypothetical protein
MITKIKIKTKRGGDTMKKLQTNAVKGNNKKLKPLKVEKKKTVLRRVSWWNDVMAYAYRA